MVEIVMAVEETFHVSIPDELAAELQTVGQIFDYLKAHADVGRWDDDREWRRLQDLVVEQLGVDRNYVTREARFIQDLGAG
jgi:acyl carrier protein